MGKLLLFMSMMSLLFLYIVTIISPNSPVLWLASVSFTYQLIRLALAFILFIQLLTQPPRQLVFRFVTSLIAVMVGAWAIGATFGYQMEFADTLAFLIASLAIGITSLEYQPDDELEDESFNNKATA